MFSYTAANTIFLNVYGASFLSYSFIFNAILMPLFGIVTMKASEKFSFQKYVIGTILFFSLILTFFLILLTFTKMKWPAMLYLLWIFIEYKLSNVLFMAILNKLFNIRQSKRVYGPSYLGTDLSYISIGLLIPVIVKITGVLNLTFFAIGFDFFSIVIFMLIYFSFPDKIKKSEILINNDNDEKKTISIKKIFIKKIVLWILSLGSMSAASLCFINTLYMDQTVKFLFNEEKIASFFSLYYSITSILVLFMKGFFTSRFINFFGMPVSLIITPLLIGISTLLFIIFINFTISPLLIFILVVNIKVMHTIFNSTINGSVYFSLFQSLPSNEKDKVINLSETIISNIIKGVAGVILLIMIRIFNAGPKELGIGILLIMVIWLIISLFLSKEYKNNLNNMLKNKILPGGELSLTDSSVMKSLIDSLDSKYPKEIIYSIEMLEKSGIQDLKQLVKKLLKSNDSIVRKKVLEIYEKNGVKEDVKILLEHLLIENEPENISFLLRALAASSEGEESDRIKGYLSNPVKVISMGAYTALIRYCGIEGILIAKSELLHLAKSSDSSDRLFAARIIGTIGYSNLYKILLPLLSDIDIDVKKTAIEAAGKLNNPKLIPLMVKNLNNNVLRPIVMRNLITCSNIVFPALEEIYYSEPQTRKLTVYLYGRIKGEEAVRKLSLKLNENDRDVLSEILNSLALCNFKPGKRDFHEFERILNETIHYSVLLLFALKDLSNTETIEIITYAIKNEIKKNKGRIFSLLYMLYPECNIKDIRFNYFYGTSEEKTAMAIELLDNILQKKHKNIVLPVLEDSKSENLLENFSKLYPFRLLGFKARMNEIITKKSIWQNNWLRASVYYLMIQKAVTENEKKFLFDIMKNNHEDTIVEMILPFTQKQADNKLSLIEIVIFIRKAGIFSDIADEILVEIAKNIEINEYLANKRIFNKNDIGSKLYIIAEGKVKIHDGNKIIANLNNGDIFGELSALNPENRATDSTALSDTILFSISQDDLFRIIEEQIEVAKGIIRILCRRIRETLAMGAFKTQQIIPYNTQIVIHDISNSFPEKEEENKKLSNIEKMIVLKTVSIFSNIPDNMLNDLAILSKEQNLFSDQVLFNKNDTGTSMYIIVSGELKVHDGDKIIAVLDDRKIIGELAALSSERRTASITALKNSRLLKLTQESLYEIMWDQREIAKEFIKVLTERLRNLLFIDN